jgi:hypothetical protein
MSTSLVRSINTSVSYSWTVSFTRDGVYLWISQSSGATRQMFKSTDNWVSYEDVTSSFTNSQYLGSHTTTFLKEYVIGAHYENPVSGIEDVIRLYKWQDLISPTLTFDGYNQLSLTNTPTYTSSKLAYYSNVYDIGTLTSDITIEKPGEYASLTFDTSSNVAYFSNATVNTIATNPLENYRSVTKLDAGVQHSSFQAGTICFWAKALDTGTSYFDGFNGDRGFLQLTTQETYHNDTNSYGVLNNANSSQIRGFSAKSSNSVYTTFSSPPSSYDPTKWNFYIVYTDSDGGTSRIYLPEFDWTATSSTYGRSHTWLRFDIDDDHVALTDVSIYTGNPGGTDSWRTTLYNNGQIGGAANETTNRVHYFRFHKDNLRYNEGTAATDISSSAEMSTSLSLPTFDGVPQLTHDTYNKLSIQNITPTATTLKYGSNTYDLGTRTDVYIDKAGTYDAGIKASDKFALVSNVVSGTIQPYTFMKNVQTIYGASSSEQLGLSDNEGGGTICFNKDGTKLALSSFNAQKVYVYTLTNGTYVLDSGMPLTSSNLYFGYAVSLNDDGTILATNDFVNSNYGDTYVYQYSGGSWSLRATFGSGSQSYTKASVLDGVGNRVLASASLTNTMKIYDWNGTTYVETYSFSGSGNFANGMDMTRDGLIVGGISKTTSDIVKVWQYSNGSWSQIGSDVSVGDMLPFFRLNRVGGTRFVTSNPDCNVSSPP